MILRWTFALCAVPVVRATGPRRAAELELRAAEESRRGRRRSAPVPSALLRVPCAQWRRRPGRGPRSEPGHQLGSPAGPGSRTVRIHQERRERDHHAAASRCLTIRSGNSRRLSAASMRRPAPYRSRATRPQAKRSFSANRAAPNVTRSWAGAVTSAPICRTSEPPAGSARFARPF